MKTFRSLRHHPLTITYENTLDLVLVATNPVIKRNDRFVLALGVCVGNASSTLRSMMGQEDCWVYH